MNIDHLHEAKGFYHYFGGFIPLDVPFTVDPIISTITKPPGSKDFDVNGKVLVASAEQSFLQLIYEKKLSNDPTEPMTRWQAITPCFRDEPVLDQLHQQYFMKLELIILNNFTSDSMRIMMDRAHDFFLQYVDCKTIETGVDMYDIITTTGEVELGSYGIRSHPLVGRWAYGTGVAEPRLSLAIKGASRGL